MTGKPLTDAEVICEFMEPRPEPAYATGSRQHPSLGGWWQSEYHPEPESPHDGGYFWHPTKLTLNECHEIEARLTDQQWLKYVAWFQLPPSMWHAKRLLHADAPTKIAALAAVLRPLVEGADAQREEQQNA